MVPCFRCQNIEFRLGPQAFLDVGRLEILQQLIRRELVHGHVPRHWMYSRSSSRKCGARCGCRSNSDDHHVHLCLVFTTAPRLLLPRRQEADCKPQTLSLASQKFCTDAACGATTVCSSLYCSASWEPNDKDMPVWSASQHCIECPPGPLLCKCLSPAGTQFGTLCEAAASRMLTS